jgi:hypothetical protein
MEEDQWSAGEVEVGFENCIFAIYTLAGLDDLPGFFMVKKTEELEGDHILFILISSTFELNILTIWVL